MAGYHTIKYTLPKADAEGHEFAVVYTYLDEAGVERYGRAAFAPGKTTGTANIDTSATSSPSTEVGVGEDGKLVAGSTVTDGGTIIVDNNIIATIDGTPIAEPISIQRKVAEELEDEADFDLLEERLLDYPALAIGQCHRAMSGMAKKLRKNVNRAMNLLNEYQQSKFDKVQRKEDLIDKYESRLGDYLIKLTKHEMNTAQTRQVSLYLHTINDFERIGDHASYIAYMSSDMHENKTQFSEDAWDELNVVMEAVREEINLTCKAFLENDKEMAQRVAPLGMVITTLCDELKMRHVERMSSGGCGLEEGTVFTDILNSFNRIAAHCASAMVALMNSDKENMDTHIHDSKVYLSDSSEYKTYLNEYNQKYEIKKDGEHMRSMEPEEVE